MRKHVGLILALALLPVLIYMALGYGGQDFKYHAASWVELHNAWHAHEWTLGWSQWAQYGLGEPRFCFYPPLSFLVGGVLTMLLPFRFVPGVVIWMIYALSGLSMYKAAGELVGRERRFLAAVLYMFNPYLVMTVVIRGAMAEAWVQAFLPLLFLYFFKAVAERRMQAAGAAAFWLAAAWLTNIPAAIGIFYGLNLLCLAWVVQRRSIRPVVAGAVIQTVAILLAGFRLFPTLQEKVSIAAENLLIYDFRLFMQLRKIPQPHLVVYLSGVYIVLSLLVLVPALRHVVRRERAWSALTLSFAVLVAFAVFFQIPPSTPLWLILPKFKFVLFPYRLLPFLSMVLVLVLSAPALSANLRRVAVVGLALLALFPFADFTRLLPFQRFPSITAAVASWQTGFEGVEEYVPATVPKALTEPKFEQQLASEGPFSTRACAPRMLEAHPNERVVQTDSSEPCALVLNTFYYPYWHASLDNGAVLNAMANSGGLIRTIVPAGRHVVRFRFTPTSVVRSVTEVVSGLMLLLVLAWPWITRRNQGTHQAS